MAHDKNKYPCLLESKSSDGDDVIVLFTSFNIGTVVKAGCGYNLGRHLSSWSMELFFPYNGTVTISSHHFL